MADVIPLLPRTTAKGVDKPEPPKLDYVWTCEYCDGQSFQLLSTGIVACVRCGFRSNQAHTKAETHWRSHLPDLPLNLAEVPAINAYNMITDDKCVHLAMRDFIRDIQTEDPVALLLIRREGGMRMWSETADTDERKDWFATRLEQFVEFVLEPPPCRNPKTS